MNRVMKSFIVHADQLDQSHGGIQVPNLELFCKDDRFSESEDEEPRNWWHQLR